jgi:peptide/nickel transport system ATP-binding protein
MSALEIINLEYRAADQRSGVPARAILRDVNLVIEKNECVGLIGESGSGKSTFARCIIGLCEPSSGCIRIDAAQVFPVAKGRRKPKRNVQMLFQNHTASLDPLMTVEKSLNEAFPSGRSDDSTLSALLESVGLPPSFLQRRPGELSGGERQRIALARALAVSPTLLILDEPTASLDVVTQVQILSLLKNIQAASGMGMLFISHDISSAMMIAKRVFKLDDGLVTQI